MWEKLILINNMNTKYNKLKTTTLMTIAVFALAGTTGITTQAFAGAEPTECTNPPSNLVGWWTLDEGAGTTSADIVGDNDGDWNGTPVVNIAEYVENSLNFGDGDSVIIPDDNSLEPENQLTVDAWVRADDSPGQWKVIVAKGIEAGVSASYALYTDTNGGLTFYVTNVTGSVNKSPNVLPNNIWDNEWHHVAGTYDNAEVKLYVDGVLIGTNPATGNILYGLPTTDDLGIGARPDNALSFEGDIDEVEIFDRALEQTEIQAIHFADSFGKCRSFVEPKMVDGLFHPGDVIPKKLTVFDIPEDGPYDILVEVTNSTEPSEECLDALDTDVLTLTNQSATDGIADTPFMLFYDEKITAMPGNYHCTVEFIANVTTSSNTYSLANQTALLDVIGSMGYWKNHPDATDVHLPIILGNETQNFPVNNNETATEIFKDHKGKFGLDKVAAQLLASALNVWALMGGYDTTCIDPTIASTNNTLGDEGYDGPGEEPDPKYNKKTNPIPPGLKANHTALDDFNNNGCPQP